MSWQVDSTHSEVQFSVRHLMISKVRGQFELFAATVDIDESNPAAASVNVEIQVDSVNTRNEQRDGHLKSPDFFDAGSYPTIRFSSTGYAQTSSNKGKLHGDLTIRDTTKAVTLDVDYSGQSTNPFSGQLTAGFEAHTEINRKDFGLTWNQALETGGVMVGEEVEISIHLELVKES